MYACCKHVAFWLLEMKQLLEMFWGQVYKYDWGILYCLITNLTIDQVSSFFYRSQ